MMITLLMAGQHSSSSASSWIMLRLATEPRIVEELFDEQVHAFGHNLPPLQYKDLDELPLHQNVIKETLRVHSSIHSIMRKVKNPLQVPGTQFIVPDTHVLLASPVMTALSEQYFPDARRWNPHRWDDEQEEERYDEMIDYGYGSVSKGTKSPYLPFGAGRHRCIGEKFAYLNLGVILATLVRNFKFYNPEDRNGIPDTDYAVSGHSLSPFPKFHSRLTVCDSLYSPVLCSPPWSVGKDVFRKIIRRLRYMHAVQCSEFASCFQASYRFATQGKQSFRSTSYKMVL
ncbi:Cytochrome P450 [Macrophomina phaseolina MS6]|uniref:Cytochrome P450 n=1 Tax=Macrophomina phaseolina (strain MS6) TaxID=1126212 RepID=K2RE72_MACPH|nr:Cytochrome P450 [Macrophomina phaseolina MS6]